MPPYNVYCFEDEKSITGFLTRTAFRLVKHEGETNPSSLHPEPPVNKHLLGNPPGSLPHQTLSQPVTYSSVSGDDIEELDETS